MIRGSAVRGVGYGLSVLLTALASVFLLRYLGVDDFGRYATVLSLIAIVSGVTDAGLTAVGARDMPLRNRGAARRRLLANLLALRLVLTPVGVAAAVLFAALVGYGSVLVAGTALAGAGLVLINTQATLMLPLSVELRIPRLTSAEVLRQALTVVGIILLVGAGASLLPFFALQIAVGALLLLATPLLVGREWVPAPRFDRAEWTQLIREALPIAISLVMNVVYFRVLIILLFLLATARETGIFATSFRVFEILFGIPTLLLTVALPLLAISHDDRPRLRYILQRMSEVGATAAVFLALLVVILAEPVIRLLGGSEYEDAAGVLQIQAFALIPVFVGQVWQLGLISIRRQRSLAIANGLALVVVLALGLSLIPRYDATGAAVAAVVAEVVLAAALLILLTRADRTLRPDFAFAWRPILAGGLMAATVAIPTLGAAVTAVVGAAVYLAITWLTGGIPGEITHAFGLRRPASS